jgi:hypothetical protein
MIVDGISSTNRIIGTYQTANIRQSDKSVVENQTKTDKKDESGEIQDKAEISPESKALLKQDKITQSGTELNSAQNAELEKLKQTDREVKAHEQAHMAAAGGIATSAPQYEYEKGSDGKMYAVGGEVNIKIAEESSPEQTVEKAQQVKKAALAPAEPSGQDRSVAQKAEQIIQNAKTELKNEQSDPNQTNSISSNKQKSQSPGVLVDVFG